MTAKHYDISYLQNSRRLLLGLKERSYALFGEVHEGIIVDLGCGAGNDVIELAKAKGDDVKIIGIDHDPVMLKQAKADSSGIGNVDFILSEAYPLPFENESVAGLRTERVIQHLTHPEKVMQDIFRVLRKDGPLVIIETDWHSLSFYTEFVDVQQKVNGYLTDVKVNNGFAARKLSSYLHLSGFSNIKFEIHPFVIHTLDEANEYFRIETITKEAAEKGYIEQQDCEAFYGALKKADNENNFACSINLVLAWCIK